MIAFGSIYTQFKNPCFERFEIVIERVPNIQILF